MQALTVAAEARAEREHDDWVRAAFTGWQVAGSISGKVGSFSSYLRRMGIKPPTGSAPTPEQIERERRRSAENVALAKRAFGRGVVRA